MINPEFLPGLVSTVPTTRIDTARVALIYRPTDDGSNEAKVKDIQDRLQGEGSSVMTHPSEHGVAGNLEVLKHLWSDLQPTLVGGLGGDGTESDILTALHQMNQKGFHMPAWLLNGGRINDLHHELYGSYNYHHPEAALYSGHFAKVHPIALTLIEPTGTILKRVAWGYGSWGASAEVGNKADSREHRRRRGQHRTPIGQFAVDAKMALDTLAEARSFTVLEDGDERQLIDLVLIRGRQMAGKLRFKNINLLRSEFGRTELATTGKLALAKTVTKAAFRGVELKTNETVRFTLQDSADGEPIRFQRDGEAELVPVGTQVTAALSNYGVYLHTTRRR